MAVWPEKVPFPRRAMGKMKELRQKSPKFLSSCNEENDEDDDDKLLRFSHPPHPPFLVEFLISQLDYHSLKAGLPACFLSLPTFHGHSYQTDLPEVKLG